MKRFREGSIEFLVATDVAARGLDVDDIEVVFNYDLPQDRRGLRPPHRPHRPRGPQRPRRDLRVRPGNPPPEMIERYTRHPIRRERVPSQEQVEGKIADQLFEDVKERLTTSKFNSYQDQVDRLLEQGFTPTDVASVLFTMLRESNGREFGEIAEDREEPRARRPDGRPAPREMREPREPRERAPRGDEGDMTPLFFSLGKVHGVRPGEIVGMLYGEAGLPQGSIGHIKLFDKHSRIDVRTEHAERLLQVVKNVKLRGRGFILDYDRGPGDRTAGHGKQ